MMQAPCSGISIMLQHPAAKAAPVQLQIQRKKAGRERREERVTVCFKVRV